MNKIYSIIYNRALGVYQVVSELAKKSRKGCVSQLKKPCGLIITTLKWSLLSCSINNAIAGNTNVLPGSTTTVITSGSTGVTYVNIAAANKNGISHNKYTDFNVNKPGMVFNNSVKDGISILGKEMQGNRNLGVSGSAKVILNEVKGINKTDINGPMEVFGQKAGVVIVNPNGISVSGGSTINMKNLTLSTGNTSVKNNDIIMDVTNGDVTIGSGGMNTTGLDYFDAIAKSIKIQGTVASINEKGDLSGDTDIKFIAGDNSYSTNDRSYNQSSKKTRSTEIAIDGGLAGSIYGSYVTLIATDSGAGVRHKGTINTANDITINSNGEISIDNENGGMQIQAKNVNATANESIKLANMKVSNNVDTSLLTDGKTEISNTESANLNINNKAKSFNGTVILEKVKTLSDLKASADDITMENVVVDEDLFLESKNDINLTDIDVGQNAILLAKNDLNFNKTKSTVDANSLTFNVGNELSINSDMQRGNVNFYGNTKAEVAGIFADNINLDNSILDISGEKDTTINVSNNMLITGDSVGQKEVSPGVWEKVEGSFAVKENGKVVMYKYIYNSKGEIIGKTPLGGEYSASSNSGVNAYNSNVTINAKNINNENGVIQSKGLNITLNAMNNNGSIYGENINLTGDQINNDFLFQADNNLNIKAKNINSTSAISATDGDLNIASNEIKNKGVLEGGSKIVITDLNGEKDRSKSQLNFTSFGDQTGDNYASIISGKEGLDITANKWENGGNITLTENSGNRSFINVNDYISSGINSNFRNLSVGGVTFNTNNFTMRDGAKYTSPSVNTQKTIINANKIRIENNELDYDDLSDLGSYNRTSTSLTGSGFDLIAKEDFYNSGIITSSVNTKIIAANFKNDKTGRIIGSGRANPSILITSSEDYNYSDDSSKSYTGIFENYGTISTSGDKVDIAFDKVNNFRPEEWGDLSDVDKNTLTRYNFFAGISSSKDLTLIAQSEVKNHGKIYSPNYLLLKLKDRDAVFENKNIDGKQSGIYSGNTLDWLMQVFNIKSYTDKKDDKFTDVNIAPDANNQINLYGDVLQIEKDALFQTKANTNIYVNEFNNKGGMWYALGGVNFEEIDFIDGLNVVHLALNKFVNDVGSYIFSPENITINSIGNIFNDGVIQSGGDVIIKSKEMSNGSYGLIHSDTAVKIKSDKINNLSTLTGNAVKKDYIGVNGGTWTKNNGAWTGNDVFSIYGFEFLNGIDISKLQLQQGQITSNGDIHIETGEHTDNNGLMNQGIIYAKNSLQINGDVENLSLHQSVDLISLMKDPSLINYNTIRFNIHRNGLGYDAGFEAKTLYDLLDFALNSHSGEDFTYGEGTSVHYQKQYMFAAIIDAANKNDFLAQMLSTVLGADYKDLAGRRDYDPLRQRWARAQSSSSGNRTLKIYPSGQTVLGGGNIDIRGALISGDNVGNSFGDIKVEEVDVKVGDADTSTIQGQLDALKNMELPDIKDEIDRIGSSSMFRPGSSDKKISINIKVDELSPGASASLSTYEKATDSDRGLTVHYLYETRIDLINQEDYYGSANFIENVKFNNIGVTDFYTAGDNYFETTLILEAYKKLKGGTIALEDNAFDANLVNELIMNAADFMNFMNSGGTSTGLPEFGKPLTKEQQALLSKDIVWYVFEEVDGKTVLTPQVYLSDESQELKMDIEATGGAIIASSSDVNISSGDKNITISNGGIFGNNVNLDATGGDINIINNNGISGGVIAAGDANLKGENITIQGAGVNGENINLEAGNVDLVASMEYDKNGDLINRHENQLAANNNITVKADSINMKGADINSEGGIELKANDIDISDVKEVSSTMSQTITGGKGYTNIYEESIGLAVSSGTNISTSSLNIETGNNLTITGGSVDAKNTTINVANDFVTKAGENYESVTTVETSYGLWAGASAGAYGGKVSDGYGAEQTGPGDHDGMAAKRGSNGRRTNIITNTPTGANAGFGYSYSSTTEHEQSKTHTNADLNLGDANIDVAKNMDIGGADFNSQYLKSDGNDSPTLNINANDIVSTKFVDEVTKTTDTTGFAMGFVGNVNSNLANLGTPEMIANNIAAGDADARQIIGGVATVLADITQLANPNLNASSGLTFEDKKTHSESKTTTENRNNIGGNVNFNAKNDIILNNVEMSGGDNIALNAEQGKVEINSGVTTGHEESKTNTMGFGVTGNAGVSGQVGVNGITGGASAGGTLSVNIGEDSSQKNSTTHQNSQLSAKNVVIKSGGDFNLNGSNIDAKESVVTDVAGNINITSQQDTKDEWSKSDNLNLNLGMSAGTGGVSPTVGVGLDVSWDDNTEKTTNKQAGIKSGGVVDIKSGGDLNLTGGNIISNGGNVDVDGNINVNEVVDTIKKDGGGFGFAGSFDPTRGTMPVVPDISFKQSERKDFQETQHGTIDIGSGNINAGGDVSSLLNKDDKNLSTVDKDKKYGAYGATFTAVDVVKKPVTEGPGPIIKEPEPEPEKVADSNSVYAVHTEVRKQNLRLQDQMKQVAKLTPMKFRDGTVYDTQYTDKNGKPVTMELSFAVGGNPNDIQKFSFSTVESFKSQVKAFNDAQVNAASYHNSNNTQTIKLKAEVNADGMPYLGGYGATSVTVKESKTTTVTNKVKNKIKTSSKTGASSKAK